MKDFPETVPSKSAQWATMCYDRTPEFKVHSTKGLAHNAIGAKKPYQEIALYELIKGTWTKVWEYRFPRLCRCGNEFEGTYGRYKYNLDPEFEGKIKDAPVICYECYRRAEQTRREAQKRATELKQLAALQAKYSQPETIDLLGRLDNLTAKD